MLIDDGVLAVLQCIAYPPSPPPAMRSIAARPARPMCYLFNFILMRLFEKKTIGGIMADSEKGEYKLRRTLGPVNLIALGIGAIIGAGLFSLTGIAAAQNSGPAVALSMVVAAIGCAFAGLCYSEFSCMIPVAGSAYTYAYTTLGEWLAWIIGWDLVLEYAVGASTVSISWSGYVVSLLRDLGIHLPPQLVAGPFEPLKLPDGSVIHGIINLPAVLIITLISFLLMLGIKESARANGVIVVIKLAVVLVFIGLGWMYIDKANYTPFIPANTGTFGHFGFSGIMAGRAPSSSPISVSTRFRPPPRRRATRSAICPSALSAR